MYLAILLRLLKKTSPLLFLETNASLPHRESTNHSLKETNKQKKRQNYLKKILKLHGELNS